MVGGRRMTIQEKAELLYYDKLQPALDSAYVNGYDCGYMDGEGYGWDNGWNDGYAEGEAFGLETGYAAGKEDGISQGYQTHHDEFWDAFQDYGKRDYYERAFTGYNFNSTNLYPKYDITPVDSNGYMFYAWSATGESKFNLAERFRECGIVLDTSKATHLPCMFTYGRFSVIPTIDLTSCVASDSTLNLFAHSYDNLITVEKIIINENVKPNGWFYNCYGLKNLTIEGKLAQNGFNVKHCSLLTKESILSIVKALSLDITETKTITFSTAHKDLIECEMPDTEPDADGNYTVEFLIWAYANDAKMAGWSFVYA
jgi:hypothetical protein